MKKVSFNEKEIVKTMTYVDALKQGLVDYDDIDDFIDVWHEGGTRKELHEFLGLSIDEYKAYFYDGADGIRKIIKRNQKK